MTNHSEKTAESTPTSTSTSTSKVSRAAGAKWPILPGESLEKYEKGLVSAINELGAKTELQMYLAEKIFQCILWIKRYETQKHAAVISQMVEVFLGRGVIENRVTVSKLFYSDKFDDPALSELYRLKGMTSITLRERAMRNCHEDLIKLDQQIALRIKSLAQLQQSYEALVNRSIIQERLRLQNEFLKRDLQAIDVKNLKELNRNSNDNSKTKSRK